ncbi:tol-pal system YbgF family protein [uncultured Sphingomonas sp.]|uniref:tol-pal system YbgF family protein n=1 Tax=uncultured Sphingomonas sp. TaxID=158754 RepID=UPI0035CADD8A
MRPILFVATAAMLFTPGVVGAQSVEGRVGKLESEMRAVQRKVFPGGAGQLLQPEIEQAPQGVDPPPGASASSPVADLTARVASLEGQIATMTGQIEQGQFRQRQLDEGFIAYRRETDARLKALEDRTTQSIPATRADASEDDARSASSLPAAVPAAAPAVVEQDTGDAGEDAYMYGYRLWTAKRYVDAETQLKKVVAAYPKHRRASYAQNLLGRSYLDGGKPSLASIAFYDNYKKMPDGERAPDSLYYLAQALRTLKKPADACKVYGELNDVYGAKIDARMKADIVKGRAAAKCS